MTSSNHTVLILGARGRFGLAAARAFALAGWQVLGQVRPGAHAPPVPGVRWLSLALDDAALLQAARGASVLVYALNPAYTNAAWTTQVTPAMHLALGLSRALGATLMLPGNVYNFGADMPAVLHEDTAQTARTVKGQVRIALEAQMRSSGVPCVVIRAGDFFGSGRGTWFDTTLVAKLHKGAFCAIGARDVVTPWAYLPDLARCFVAVAERRAQLGRFEVFHFKGHGLSPQHWLDALTPIAHERAWLRAGSALKLNTLPWGVIGLGAWLLPTWAAVLEMRYLWQTPHALANDKLAALIGAEPHTPLAQAARQALEELKGPPPSAAPVSGARQTAR